MQCILFLIHFLRLSEITFCSLSLWCTECKLTWTKKSNLKQVSMRLQHNKMWNKWRGTNTLCFCEVVFVHNQKVKANHACQIWNSNILSKCSQFNGKKLKQKQSLCYQTKWINKWVAIFNPSSNHPLTQPHHSFIKTLIRDLFFLSSDW